MRNGWSEGGGGETWGQVARGRRAREINRRIRGGSQPKTRLQGDRLLVPSCRGCLAASVRDQTRRASHPGCENVGWEYTINTSTISVT